MAAVFGRDILARYRPDGARRDALRRGGGPTLPGRFAAPHSGVLVAIGSEAATAVWSRRMEVPVICSMALHSDLPAAGSDPSRAISVIPLDVPLEALADRIRSLFPDKTRVAILRNSRRGQPALNRPAGLTWRIADCARAEDLLRTFAALRGEVDFVWCVPDAELFNSSTVQALLRSSLVQRIPVIGFSESFVRAGAAVGIYPDFREIGVQTAKAVERCQAGGMLAAVEPPKVFRLLVNLRVTRLLGLEPPRRKGPEVAYIQ